MLKPNEAFKSLSMRRFSKLLTGFTLMLFAAACATPAPVVYYPPPGTPEATEDVPPQGNFAPNAALFKCAGLSVSNAPPVDAERRIIDFKPVIVVDGVVLASVPVNDVCLTSGFGIRNGRSHDGIDLQSRPAGTIYSAAPGRILEAGPANGYGNMIVIAHGGGVFTRYGHLASFASGIVAGQRIGFGQPIGLMGRSGNATAIHLHFEILTGYYDTPRKSFGLTPRDPFSFPAYMLSEAGS